MSTTGNCRINDTKVRAVREPGYANIWCVQDAATGLTVAHVTINEQAEAWAKRIEAALNAQLAPTN